MCCHSKFEMLTPTESAVYVGKKFPVEYAKKKGKTVVDARKHTVKIRSRSGFTVALIDGDIRNVAFYQVRGESDVRARVF